jgi:effector-binding domain-containing protein
MKHPCMLKERTPQPALAIRSRANTAVESIPQRIEEAYKAIAEYMQALGEQPAGPPYAAYYNMDMTDLDLEAGVPVTRAMPGNGEICAGELPGGRAATCLYTGPYHRLEEGYNALSDWIQENRYETTGVAYEFYLNSPVETPPEELQTEIVYPLRAQ